MLKGPLGTGSDLLQTRSDQARTEVAWEVAEAVQQELEVPSSRTGSSTSEIGSGLAGTRSGLVWGVGGGGWFSLCGEGGEGRTSCFRRKLELTLRRSGGLRRIFLVFSGTCQDLPSLVLCAAFRTAKVTAICGGRPNLSCSSLPLSQYNLCHSTGLPQEPTCCPQ